MERHGGLLIVWPFEIVLRLCMAMSLFLCSWSDAGPTPRMLDGRRVRGFFTAGAFSVTAWSAFPRAHGGPRKCDQIVFILWMTGYWCWRGYLGLTTRLQGLIRDCRIILALARTQSESSLSSSSPDRLRFFETGFGTSSFLTKT